jgi:hypothetical protein
MYFFSMDSQIDIVEILLKLRAKDDNTFKVDFHVDFYSIEYIAKDVLNFNMASIIINSIDELSRSI